MAKGASNPTSNPEAETESCGICGICPSRAQPSPILPPAWLQSSTATTNAIVSARHESCHRLRNDNNGASTNGSARSGEGWRAVTVATRDRFFFAAGLTARFPAVALWPA